jgi:heme/copper-type cytochrome/quinol oxidase subunit 2
VIIALAILFVLLVAADIWLTYRIIKSGNGRESAFARRYIGNVPLTIVLTVAGAVAILALALLSGFYWPLIAATALWAWVVWHNWRIFHAR